MPTKIRPRAKQFRGVPDMPIISLVPLLPNDQAEWSFDDDDVAIGMKVNGSCRIPCAPIPIPRMKMEHFVVALDYMATSHNVLFSFTLKYRSNGEESALTLASPPIFCRAGRRGRFGFSVPLDDLDRTGMFTCSLVVTISETPSPAPSLLLRGMWVQIAD